MTDIKKKNNIYIEIILIIISSLLLFITSAYYNDVFTEIMSVATYLTWHNLFEFLSIIASFSIFIVTYYIYEESGNLRMIILPALFTMAFIDTFSYIKL